MRAVFESLFDVAYLACILILGIRMIGMRRKSSVAFLYGLMALVLGGGDAFHLVPRVIALVSGTLDQSVAALGFGTAVTSITMTIFYVLLYHVWEIRYRPVYVFLTRTTIYVLALVRIVLCLLPMNDWMSADAPLYMGIVRNIPFALMGIIVCVLFFQQATRRRDIAFRWMWLAIALSFAFYVPVVLFADAWPPVGMLMIPKTIMYVWIVSMLYRDAAQRGRKSRLLR